MKLGTKVKCKGYLKKVKTHHVIPYFSDPNKDENCLIDGVEIEEDITQITKEYIECEFEGIVVAIKDVSTERYFELGENEWTGKPYMRIHQEGGVKCYQVFFRMGGSRLVPIDKCEVV